MEDWVHSKLFSVQRGHILIFSPKSQSQILHYQILNICRVRYIRRVCSLNRQATYGGPSIASALTNALISARIGSSISN